MHGKTFEEDMYVRPWIVELSKNSFTEFIFQLNSFLKGKPRNHGTIYKRACAIVELCCFILLPGLNSTTSPPHDSVDWSLCQLGNVQRGNYDKEGRQPNVASIPLSTFCVNIDFHIGPVSVSVVCDQKNKKILLKDFLVLT